MGTMLLKGKTYSGYMFNVDSYAEVKGDGVQLKMTPSKLVAEEMIDGKYIFENRFGTFQIGEQLKPGEYQVIVETTSQEYLIYVLTTNNVIEGMTDGTKYETRGGTFSDEDPQSQTIYLAEGSILKTSTLNNAEGNRLSGAKDVKITLKYLGDTANRH